MIQIGDIITTNYARERVVVIEIDRWCKCPEYHVSLECDGTPCCRSVMCDSSCPLTQDDEPHMHIVGVLESQYRPGHRHNNCLRWYGGYVHDGDNVLRNVWHKNDIIRVIGRASGVQLSLV